MNEIKTEILVTTKRDFKEKELIYVRVQKIFEKLNNCVKLKGLIDTVKLARLFGFEIVEHKGLPKLLNGMITSDSNGNQIIINNNISKEQKRYSITYLLSTYLLYYKKQNYFMFTHLDNDEDLGASYMARLLLIPERDLRNMSLNGVEDIQCLADIFQVPSCIMEQRIEEVKETKGLVLKRIKTKNE